MEPIKIPQNVYIEDRIVGPLTLRQIVIVGVGGGFSYALWAMLNKAYGGISLPLTVMVWLPAVLSAAIAFVKVNDLSLTHLFLLFLERLNKPTVRTWAPRQGFSIHFRTTPEPKKTVLGAAPEESKTQRLENLTTTLDAALKPVAPAAPQAAAPAEEADPLERTLTINTAPSRLPVNKDRITASPAAGAPLDGVSPTGSVSIFRDITPR